MSYLSNHQTDMENSTSFKEDFERKMRILGQLKIAKRLRAIFEQAADQAENASPEEAKQILLDQSANLNELVSLTEALRKCYTLDSYQYYNSMVIFNEKKQEMALQRSEDIISTHLDELRKERESPPSYDPQALMTEETPNAMQGKKKDSRKDPPRLNDKSISNEVELNADSATSTSTIRKRKRKSKANFIDFDDDLFDDQYSTISSDISSKKKKKKAPKKDDFDDGYRVNKSPKNKKIEKRAPRKKSPSKKLLLDIPSDPDPDYVEETSIVPVRVKYSNTRKSASKAKVDAGEQIADDPTVETFTVKISMAGEETISLIATREIKISADQPLSSNTMKTDDNIDIKNTVDSSIDDNDVDTNTNVTADNVNSTDVDIDKSKETNGSIFESGTQSTNGETIKPTAKKRKPRINLTPRKCVNCNKSSTAYFRCHFWFMNGTKCGKIWCKECLTTKFDVEDYDSIVSDAEWHCPSCLGRWARSSRSRRRR